MNGLAEELSVVQDRLNKVQYQVGRVHTYPRRGVCAEYTVNSAVWCVMWRASFDSASVRSRA